MSAVSYYMTIAHGNQRTEGRTTFSLASTRSSRLSTILETSTDSVLKKREGGDQPPIIRLRMLRVICWASRFGPWGRK